MPSRELPVFPLPIVLFPDAPQMLRIFEPRYRQLVADCGAGDGRFGICYLAADRPEPPPAGSIGCEATIESVWPLPDGDSNILVRGVDRYAVREYLESDRPYLTALVEPYDDHGWEPAPDGELVQEVRRAFLHLARAVNALKDEPARAVEAPDEPAALSFHVAAAVDFDIEVKLELLKARLATERLRRLRDLLSPLNQEASRRMVVHQRAKRNGKGPRGLVVTDGGDEP
jgi:Lon protease-like protein